MRRVTPFIKEIINRNPWQLIVATVLMVTTSAIEGASLLLLKPLLSLSNIIPTEKEDVFSRFVHNNIHFKITVLDVLIVYIILIAILASLNYIRTNYTQGLTYKFTSQLQQKLYKAFINSSWLSIINTKRSDLNQLLTHEISAISYGVTMLTSLLATLILTAIYLATAFLLSWHLTLVAIFSGLLLYAILHYKSYLSYKIGKTNYKYFQKLYSTINDHLLGTKLVKTYALEKHFQENFNSIVQEITKQKRRFVSLQANTTFVYTIGGALIFSIIFYAAITKFHIPLATLLIMLIIFSRLVPKVSMLQKNYQNLTNTAPSFEATQEMAKRFQPITTRMSSPRTRGSSECLGNLHLDPPDSRVRGNDGWDVQLPQKIEIKKFITLDNISFTYTNKQIFSNLTLSIPANKTTVIIGPSGAGKTTMIDLIIGLIKPSSGEILIDGKQLDTKQTKTWRQSIAYVPQNNHLLNDTIRHNLTWLTPNISEQNINIALKQANIAKFVDSLPDKLDTIVGDDGLCLSGGEKQRILLARALLRKPSLLILDEATNSLDSKNEAEIYDTINKLKQNMTVIIITHKNSTLKWADKTISLEESSV